MQTSKHLVSHVMLGMSLAISLSACNAPASGSSSSAVAPSRAVSAARCADCGTISNVEEVKEKGSSSGAGAVIGAVAGAVVGHQVGDGRGKEVATAAGAIGGGIAGNEIEKRSKSTTHFHVTVAMENGTTQAVDIDAMNGLSTGSKVRVVGNSLQVVGT